MKIKIKCPHCGHNQKLFGPTLVKLKSYGHRIIRCSNCHRRIKLKGRPKNI